MTRPIEPGGNTGRTTNKKSTTADICSSGSGPTSFLFDLGRYAAQVDPNEGELYMKLKTLYRQGCIDALHFDVHLDLETEMTRSVEGFGVAVDELLDLVGQYECEDEWDSTLVYTPAGGRFCPHTTGRDRCECAHATDDRLSVYARHLAGGKSGTEAGTTGWAGRSRRKLCRLRAGGWGSIDDRSTAGPLRAARRSCVPNPSRPRCAWRVKHFLGNRRRDQGVSQL